MKFGTRRSKGGQKFLCPKCGARMTSTKFPYHISKCQGRSSTPNLAHSTDVIMEDCTEEDHEFMVQEDNSTEQMYDRDSHKPQDEPERSWIPKDESCSLSTAKPAMDDREHHKPKDDPDSWTPKDESGSLSTEPTAEDESYSSNEEEEDDPDPITQMYEQVRVLNLRGGGMEDTEVTEAPSIHAAENVEEDWTQTQRSILEEIEGMTALTLHDKSMLALIIHCNRTKAPKGFFDSFMSVLKKEIRLNNFQVSKADTRGTFVTRMRDLFPCPVPTFVNVPVRSGAVPLPLKMKMNASNFVRVMKFSFREQLNDLLNDFSLFGNIDNLCVNETTEDRFKLFCPTDKDILVEVLGANWYKRTGQFLSKDQTEFLMPLIFYADKTGTDVNQRYSLEPWLFTLALFRRSVRENPDAWRYLGFIPDLHTIATKGMTPEEKMDLYHRVLEAILEEVLELQQNPPVVDLRLGDQVKRVKLILKVAFVMGDQKSNDNVCCRTGATFNTGRIHRGCMCSSLHADDPTVDCEWIDPRLVTVISKYCHNRKLNNPDLNLVIDSLGTEKEKEEAKKYLIRQGKIATNICNRVLSMHPVLNAFRHLDFGANLYGIFRAALDDTLHFSEAGFFHYLIQIIYDPMHPKESQRVDILIESHLGKQTLRSSCRDQYPRINFTRGFSQLTLLTHSEKVGVILATLVLLHTETGRSTLDKVFLRQQLKFQGKKLDNGPSKAEVMEAVMPKNKKANMKKKPQQKKKTQQQKKKPSVPAPSSVPQVLVAPNLDGDKPKKPSRPKKKDGFPKTRRAYLFVVQQIKKHSLSFILHQTLDKLQLEFLFESVWEECRDLYQHRHDKAELSLRFPKRRLETEGYCFYDPNLFCQQRKENNTPVEQSMFSLVEILEDEDHSPLSDDDSSEGSDDDNSQKSADSYNHFSDDQPGNLVVAGSELQHQPPNHVLELPSFSSDEEDEPLPNPDMNPDLSQKLDDEPLSSLLSKSKQNNGDGELLLFYSDEEDDDEVEALPTSTDINHDLSDDSDNKPLSSLTTKSKSVVLPRPKSETKSRPPSFIPSSKKYQKPFTRYAATNAEQKKMERKKGDGTKKITALQTYFKLNIGKQRRPIGKDTREKLANTTGSTAAVLCDVFDFLKLLEFTLCWHAFTKYEDRLPLCYRQDSKAIDMAVRKMMELFKTWFYRGDNSADTKTCKFHSHIHTVSNRLEFGSLLQYDTGKGERNLKHTKGLAATAQKRGEDIFTEQTGYRILDHFVLRRADKVLDLLFPSKDTMQHEDDASTGDFALLKGNPRFRLDLETMTCTHLNSKGRPSKGAAVTPTMDPFVLTWVKTNLAHQCDDNQLLMWTEIKPTDNKNQAFFRAHPQYDHKGAWYDWAMIAFTNKKNITTPVPGKLLGFYRGTDDLEYGIAHCCSWKNGRGGVLADSLLCQHWKLEYDTKGQPILETFELRCILDGCLVIEKGRDITEGLIPPTLNKVPPKQQDESIIRIVARKDEWPKQFVKWGRELLLDPGNTYLLPSTISYEQK
jgi:predicted RNase H-like HicB family nuclease